MSWGLMCQKSQGTIISAVQEQKAGILGGIYSALVY